MATRLGPSDMTRVLACPGSITPKTAAELGLTEEELAEQVKLADEVLTEIVAEERRLSVYREYRRVGATATEAIRNAREITQGVGCTIPRRPLGSTCTDCGSTVGSRGKCDCY